MLSHLVSKSVHDKVQLVADKACRLPCPHHKLVEFAFARCPLVSVVLLVAAMELHELSSCLIDVGAGFTGDLLHQWMTQIVTLVLDGLNLYRAADDDVLRKTCLTPVNPILL